MRASSPLLKLLNFAHAAVRGAGRLCLLLSNSSIDQKGWTPATYALAQKIYINLLKLVNLRMQNPHNSSHSPTSAHSRFILFPENICKAAELSERKGDFSPEIRHFRIDPSKRTYQRPFRALRRSHFGGIYCPSSGHSP